MTQSSDSTLAKASFGIAVLASYVYIFLAFCYMFNRWPL